MTGVSGQTNQSQRLSGKAVWAALRQLEALRESLTWTLDGKFLFRATEDEASHLRGRENFTDGWALLTLNDETLPVWLTQQGLADFASGEHPSINMAIDRYRLRLLGAEAYKAVKSGQRSAYQGSDDFGADRSSAGWLRSINFCITSAFVRILGAWEQYEIDVLKALFNYRPTGDPLGAPEDHIVEEAEESVIREEPKPDPDDRNRVIYTMPPVWTWVKKYAENNVDRRTILSRVFGIELAPGSTKNERKENNSRRDQWYDKRNAIAHGRASIEMTLAEYVEADVFVYRSIGHLAEQCRGRQKLIV